MAYIYETADSAIYSALKDLSLENRKRHTEAEAILWNLLKARRFGHKFRRQHVIGKYIVDFVCLKVKLVIEVDGKYHFYEDQPISDEQRTAELNGNGFTVIRFTNEDVIGNTSRVINEINKTIKMVSNNAHVIKNTVMSAPNNQSPAQPKNYQSPAQTPPPFGGGRGEADAWAVDAGCSGNPGPMEYQCIDLQTGVRVFHYGPVHGTNNIGEFLAIVHALALCWQKGLHQKTIYSDSYNAILWVKNRRCKTKLERTPQTAPLYDVIQRAERWLQTHDYRNPIVKWETSKWGEIPADFGRK